MTKKDAFYFPHDSNAHRDPKIIRLLQVHGWEGYGVYWAVIEMLRDEKDYTLATDYETYAFALRTDYDLLKSIVENFKLFEVEGGFFHSPSLKRRMEKKDEKSAKARASALARWERNADALKPQSEGNAKEEKRREKKRKEESKVKKGKYGTFSNVLLTDDEYAKLTKRFNGTSQDRIDRLSEYIESKGERYKSHYATILAWARRDGKNKNGNPAPPSSDPAKNIYGKGAI